MELNDYKSRLKSGALGGCYLFTGEEDYLVRHYLGELCSAAGGDPSLATFNRISFDGAEVDIAALTDAVKAPPMFEDYKLIIWQNASFVKMKESDLDALEELCTLVEECGYAVLAFTSPDGEVDLGSGKRESKFARRFGKRMAILRFDRSTDAQLLSWLKKHFDREGIGADADTLRALIFRSGHSMSVLKGEVDKLSAYAKARGITALTAAHINEVASSTPESDTFAFSNAVTDRNRRAALLALDEMKLRRVEPVVIMAMMARTLSELSAVSAMMEDGMGKADIAAKTGLNPFRVGLYMSGAKKYKGGASAVLTELSRVDAASKFGGVSGYTAIELFICRFI